MAGIKVLGDVTLIEAGSDRGRRIIEMCEALDAMLRQKDGPNLMLSALAQVLTAGFSSDEEVARWCAFVAAAAASLRENFLPDGRPN